MKLFKEFSKYAWIILIYFILTFIGSILSMTIISIYHYLMIKNGLFDVNEFTLDYLMNQAPYTLMALGIAGLIMIIYMYFRHWKKVETLSLNNLSMIKYFLMGMGVNFILSIGLGLLLPETIVETTNEQAASIFQGSAFLVIAVTAIIVPIFEETLFRGFLMKNKFVYMLISKIKGISLEEALESKLGFFFVALIQAMLFGSMHGNLVQFGYATILGLLFAYVNKEYKSLLPSICMHCGLNFYTAIGSCYPQGILIYVFMSFVGIVLFLHKLFYDRRVKS